MSRSERSTTDMVMMMMMMKNNHKIHAVEAMGSSQVFSLLISPLSSQQF